VHGKAQRADTGYGWRANDIMRSMRRAFGLGKCFYAHGMKNSLW
jgi:hypothetical protein